MTFYFLKPAFKSEFKKQIKLTRHFVDPPPLQGAFAEMELKF